MSSAHIFYIPIALFIGLLAGFYMGRHAAQNEAQELRKRRERRQALRDKKAALGSKAAGVDEAEGAEAAGESEESA